MQTTSGQTPNVDELFHLGHYADVVRILAPLRAKDRLSEEHRLLLARAILHAGDVDSARELAEGLSGLDQAPFVRARAELVIGMVARRLGDFGEARRRLQHAVRLSRESRDAKQEAWSQLCLFRLLAEGESEDLVNAALEQTRKLVTSVADPHLSAYLHDSVCILEAQTGRLNEARRHLDVASAIIQHYPNAWLEQVVHTSRLCLACVELDVAKAAKHGKSARLLSQITGGFGDEHTVDNNEAHINVFGGRFARAFSSLQTVLQRGRGYARLAALEDLARLHFALGRLEDCQDALDRIRVAETDPSVADCYAARRAAPTRIKLLIRRGLFQQAIDGARKEATRAHRLGDRPLLAILTFLEAQALARAGRTADASLTLFRAAECGATSFRESLAPYFQTCRTVLDLSGCDHTDAIGDRARRVWEAEGNVCALVEDTSPSDSPREVKDTRWETQGFAPYRTLMSDSPTTAAYVLDSVAAAFDVWFDPRLICAEMINLAAVSGCSSQVRIIEKRRRGIDRSLAAGEGVAGLNGFSSLPLELRCSPTSDAIQNLAMSSILRIARAVEALSKARQEERARAALWPAEDLPEGDGLFISPEMTTLAATARKVAPTTVPVLITGETGTGKEILARAIHAASTRAKAPFLPFNCSSGPRDMIDAQLFGHRRGAFTGATEHAPGVIRGAAGGTLFLDEIGESPLEVQPKLLRFLESGEIHPLGEAHPTRIDVRVIAATNVDLDAAVSAGRFREDLFYRLNIVRLHLPPLRERRVEIPVFAHHYLRKYAGELGKGDLRLAEETVEYLLLYRWPGNVRQLANEMRRMAALAETDAVLMPEHLSSDIVAARRTVPASQRTLDSNELVVRLDQPLAAATEHLERAMIPYALRHCDGRVEDAAQKLGLSRKGLYLKRMRLGLEVSAPQARTA